MQFFCEDGTSLADCSVPLAALALQNVRQLVDVIFAVVSVNVFFAET